MNKLEINMSLVKQAIGQSNIIPWSRTWKKDGQRYRDDPDNNRRRTPQGGLILHWVVSVIIIAGSASIQQDVLESIGVPGYIQSYAHCLSLSTSSYI